MCNYRQKERPTMYAEDIERIYSDGDTDTAYTVKGEKCLIANIIQRALLDIRLFIELPASKRSITRGNLAVAAHEWIHTTRVPADTPFSFVWCCHVIYPTCGSTVVSTLRKATKTPIDLTTCKRKRYVPVSLKKGGGVTRDRKGMLSLLDMPIKYKDLPRVRT